MSSDATKPNLDGYPNKKRRERTDWTVVSLRIREDLRQRLQQAAQANNNSMNYEIATRLVGSLDAQELDARVAEVVRRCFREYLENKLEIDRVVTAFNKRGNSLATK